jgi:hypothetical protein
MLLRLVEHSHVGRVMADLDTGAREVALCD